MKTDRLLSMIIYLINRDLVSARELSERFGVSIRTIQRDMETINLAGIPVASIQGPNGGYSIMDTYKMDRQFMSLDDLYYIITALKGIGSSLEDKKINNTIEKMQGLIPSIDTKAFSERHEKLRIDFSMLGGNEQQRTALAIIQEAVNTNRLLRFSYTNNKLEATERTIEPMTIVFKWRAWYLYGYCKLKNDYRIFRASKIREPEILAKTFIRREKSFDDFEKESNNQTQQKNINIKLKFTPEMANIIEEYYSPEVIEYRDEKHTIINLKMPEDGWLYGYILSFGRFVEVLEPPHLREIIKNGAKDIVSIYGSSFKT
ncbi:MAG: YafY family protein [Spirochaetales bacterium]|nr:YafY family protein [Spirochaetales bacterium]